MIRGTWAAAQRRMSAQGAHTGSMHDVLKKYWGFSAFRSPQQGIIEGCLAGDDQLVVMVRLFLCKQPAAVL